MEKFPAKELDDVCVAMDLYIPRQDVVEVQAFFDLHEHLGTLRTLKVSEGLVRVLTTKDNLPECQELLLELSSRFEIRPFVESKDSEQ